jgi:hypothetical protein
VVVAVVALVVTSNAAGKSEVADAAMRGDKAAVQKLIAAKADVNAAQADGATALHWAVYRGDKELVGLLVRAGANPKAASREGSTPLWLASINGRRVDHCRPARGGRRPEREAAAWTHAADDCRAHR